MSVIDQSPVSGDQVWDPAPGVDIVMPMPEGTDERVLDPRTLKLIGALHRRFWTRRRELLLSRAHNGEESSSVPTMSHASLMANFVGDEAATWDGRVGQLERIARATYDEIGVDVEPLVAVRGWEDTDCAVLVDGRAVPGCVFDIVAALMIGADAFRREQSPFALSIPAPADEVEAKLWSDLIDLAHDRSGIDRGTVRIETR